MSDPQSKDQVIDQLRQIQRGVSDTVQAIPPSRFDQGSAEHWSPAGYLKHLLLAVIPFGKAVNFPPEQVSTMFGAPDHASPLGHVNRSPK